MARVAPKLFAISGAIVAAFEPPAIQGIGSFGGFQFELQDLGRNTLQDLDEVAHKIVAGSRQRKDLTGLFTSFTANDPQQLVQIDREKAKAIGVPLSQVTQALGVYMGSQYVNDFDFNNRSYRVYVQADQPFRMTAQDLRQYYVRSDTNGLVPLGNIVTLKDTAGPQVISHFNLFRSAEIDGAAAPGYSSGQGLKAMEELAKQNMLQGMSFSWSGLALEEVEAGGKAIIIFGLGILVVYLTLSAQYESFALALHHSAGRAHGGAGRAVVYLDARTGGRRLRADRTGDADRPFGEELHSDRGVCRAADRAGPHRSPTRPSKPLNCACARS